MSGWDGRGVIFGAQITKAFGGERATWLSTTYFFDFFHKKNANRTRLVSRTHGVAAALAWLAAMFVIHLVIWLVTPCNCQKIIGCTPPWPSGSKFSRCAVLVVVLVSLPKWRSHMHSRVTRRLSANEWKTQNARLYGKLCYRRVVIVNTTKFCLNIRFSLAKRQYCTITGPCTNRIRRVLCCSWCCFLLFSFFQ